MTERQLPPRALLCPYREIPCYELEDLRTVANRYQINSNRKKFYGMCQRLALQYYQDLMNEYDFHALRSFKTIYGSALADGRRFASSLDPMIWKTPAYSWYRETNINNYREIYPKDLHELITEFNADMERCINRLPDTPKSHPRLALRTWANAHMDFWKNTIFGRITIPNERKDDMSRCHRFLGDLLTPIDPDAVKQLPTIIRERRTAERQRTERASA